MVLVAWGVLSTGGWRALTMITSIPIAVALVAGKCCHCLLVMGDHVLIFQFNWLL